MRPLPPPPSLPLSEDSKSPTYPEHHIPSPTSIKWEKSDKPNCCSNDLSKYFYDVKVLSVLIAGNGDTKVSGFCLVDLELEGKLYRYLHLSVLPELCADLILGLDF